MTINPDLRKPCFQDKLEFQRICISRYRTGSHNLLIEKGRRNPQIPRAERLCKCRTNIQTIQHVIMSCHLLDEIRTKYNIADITSGITNEDFLTEMENKLDI